ncbi:MAG: fluoride efflux transporter CrcB [Candidatus Omnitrophica bacterium]|nr:fluoride efflux transporter CrcB [Candidatus Omnitrophota bacterium]
MNGIVLIFTGGGLGALVRYFLSSFLQRGIFPVGTVAVNLIGCLCIGALWALHERCSFAPEARLFLFVGILGGFTTFSSFSLETFNLVRAGDWRLAILNVVISNVAGIALTALGFWGVKKCLHLFVS